MKCRTHEKHEAIYCIVCATDAGQSACEAHEQLSNKIAATRAVVELAKEHECHHYWVLSPGGDYCQMCKALKLQGGDGK